MLNSGDFGRVQPWWSSRVHPLAHLPSRLAETIVHFLLPRPDNRESEGDVDWRPWWRGFRQRWPMPVVIVAYPTKDELLRHDPAALRHAASLAGPGVRILDAARDPRWRADLYRDDRRPTPEGNAVLAAIIADSAPER
ncbi:hypothetical protein Q4F19_04910 [Sphingomonas sp. BIUV-7]|uniref:Uncharacterized protein n=1 Tax=Sphingomonas natans TaxID=3063330 RepID=A0ABT8Y5W2_9SPHN|nr:hypothetical protein [Sphingomonas sp. BIUV-7]MDO6413717.1 hypothetical protein [Sphingomonas sp. BIUV-7]